jgi:hypothetical protein
MDSSHPDKSLSSPLPSPALPILPTHRPLLLDICPHHHARPTLPNPTLTYPTMSYTALFCPALPAIVYPTLPNLRHSNQKQVRRIVPGPGFRGPRVSGGRPVRGDHSSSHLTAGISGGDRGINVTVITRYTLPYDACSWLTDGFLSYLFCY